MSWRFGDVRFHQTHPEQHQNQQEFPGKRKAVSLSAPIVARRYVMSRFSDLKLLSADAEVTGIVKSTEKMLCRFGYKSFVIVPQFSNISSFSSRCFHFNVPVQLQSRCHQ